ncbi:MAG: HAD family hydrolase [bacterium]
MKVAIFDIDGTLTQTNQVDTTCFVQAFENVFLVNIENTDWSNYTHTTDSGIASKLFQEYFERRPTEDELCSLQNHFVNLLQQSYKANPKLFSEVPGASKMLSTLLKNKNWAVAIATGCWRASAQLKLEFAGIDVQGIPAAFADEAFSKEKIIQTALSRIKGQHCNINFEKVVYVGDRIWDKWAAKQLGIGFLGIHSEGNQMRLRDEGVSVVLPDYLDYNCFIQALENANIPDKD